jgi:hypothetical protein
MAESLCLVELLGPMLSYIFVGTYNVVVVVRTWAVSQVEHGRWVGVHTAHSLKGKYLTVKMVGGQSESHVTFVGGCICQWTHCLRLGINGWNVRIFKRRLLL